MALQSFAMLHMRVEAPELYSTTLMVSALQEFEAELKNASSDDGDEAKEVTDIKAKAGEGESVRNVECEISKSLASSDRSIDSWFVQLSVPCFVVRLAKNALTLAKGGRGRLD